MDKGYQVQEVAAPGRLAFPMNRLELENVVIALEDRERYLKVEIRENERCDWVLTTDALKRDLKAVRALLARLSPLLNGEGHDAQG